MPAFWGCVVKSGTVVPFVPPPDGSCLHISQATLGDGAAPGARVALRIKTGEDDDSVSVLLCAFRHVAPSAPGGSLRSRAPPPLRSSGAAESTQLDLIVNSYAEFICEARPPAAPSRAE